MTYFPDDDEPSYETPLARKLRRRRKFVAWIVLAGVLASLVGTLFIRLIQSL